MEYFRVCFLAAGLIALFRGGDGLPGGPPVAANPNLCETMTPQHRPYSPQNSMAPFKLVLNATCYTPRVPLLVTVTGQEVNQAFKGFFVQARIINYIYNSFATFSTDNDPDMSVLDCFNKSKNAIGHNNPNKKAFVSKSFLWTGDNDLNLDLEFVATVVQSFDTFWVGIKHPLPRCNGTQNYTTEINLSSTTTAIANGTVTTNSPGVTSNITLVTEPSSHGTGTTAAWNATRPTTESSANVTTMAWNATTDSSVNGTTMAWNATTDSSVNGTTMAWNVTTESSANGTTTASNVTTESSANGTTTAWNPTTADAGMTCFQLKYATISAVIALLLVK